MKLTKLWMVTAMRRYIGTTPKWRYGWRNECEKAASEEVWGQVVKATQGEC